MKNKVKRLASFFYQVGMFGMLGGTIVGLSIFVLWSIASMGGAVGNHPVQFI